MAALVLACGVAAARPEWRKVPAIPGKSDIDALLASGVDRIVVYGADAALASVVLRLVRLGRLGDIAVGFVPVSAKESAVARLWGLPEPALEFAQQGAPVRMPLVRDDSGGVLVGLGRIGPIDDGEAYCDDALALRGRARVIEVTPGPAGVAARVVRGGFRRPGVFAGRAIQTGCRETTVVHDGITHPRPVKRWTWYRHTEDLRAISLPR